MLVLQYLQNLLRKCKKWLTKTSNQLHGHCPKENHHCLSLQHTQHRPNGVPAPLPLFSSYKSYKYDTFVLKVAQLFHRTCRVKLNFLYKVFWLKESVLLISSGHHLLSPAISVRCSYPFSVWSPLSPTLLSPHLHSPWKVLSTLRYSYWMSSYPEASSHPFKFVS